MNLLAKLKLDGLNRTIYDSPFHKQQAERSEIAHFCEHDGICIRFTQARNTWHALAPCALKPWWLFLNPLRQKQQNKNNKTTNAEEIEVTENA